MEQQYPYLSKPAQETEANQAKMAFATNYDDCLAEWNTMTRIYGRHYVHMRDGKWYAFVNMFITSIEESVLEAHGDLGIWGIALCVPGDYSIKVKIYRIEDWAEQDATLKFKYETFWIPEIEDEVLSRKNYGNYMIEVVVPDETFVNNYKSNYAALACPWIAEKAKKEEEEYDPPLKNRMVKKWEK